MTQNSKQCIWEHNTDFSHEIQNNDIYYTTLEAIKTSCLSKNIWSPTINSESVSNIINPTIDFKFCPFCGHKVKNTIIIDL